MIWWVRLGALMVIAALVFLASNPEDLAASLDAMFRSPSP
jgi:hypothetical protein